MPGSKNAISPESFSNFGELLRYLRRRAELSQRELALHVGYHYSYMSRIENNEYVPDLAMLMARFVPALGLEKEPDWTKRLLDLASLGSERQAQHARDESASSEPESESTESDIESPLDLFPVSLTSLLGRREDIATLLKSFSQPDIRLITLVGPPGVGKTRLAVQTATEAAGMFAHGLKFIDLAPITDPNGFLPALAQNLGVLEVPDIPLSSRLAQALRQKNILLVLDNFEQLVDAAPQVYQLLSATPRVKLLVTSRVPLHIAGEQQYTVQPLSLPEDNGNINENVKNELMEFAAIQLFVERAMAVQSDFELNPENSRSVLEICRKLDGLPLAIELAAARVKTFSVQVMLKEIEHLFDWAAPNYREEQTTKQTLRGAFEWSYNLLSEKEQMLLRRLSVFSGGRTVETARNVCADGKNLVQDEIFDLMIQLADKSLLFAEKSTEETRFNLLETIHEFSREKLIQSGEEIEFRNRHLAYFCGVAEQFEAEIEGKHQTDWLDRAEIEHNNMRAALDWSLKEGGDLQTGIRLAASLGLFWYLHSHFIEGLQRIKPFLQKARNFTEERILAKLLFRTADLHLHQAEFDAALELVTESVALCRKIDDKFMLAWALYVMGDIYLAIQDLNAAEQALTESVEVCIEIGYKGVQDISLLMLSTILLRKGELDRAYPTVLEGLALAERLSDPWGVAAGLRTLGEIMLQKNDYAAARNNFERSLEASRKVGDKFIIGGAYVNLASLAYLQGQFDESDQFAEEALGMFQLIGDETQQPYPLRLMGFAAVQAGNFVRARILFRESLAGETRLQNQGGQLACLVGLAPCMLAEKNTKEALKLCLFIEDYLGRSNLKFMESDEAALEATIKDCKRKLGKTKVELAHEPMDSMNLDDFVRQYLN